MGTFPETEDYAPHFVFEIEHGKEIFMKKGTKQWNGYRVLIAMVLVLGFFLLYSGVAHAEGEAAAETEGPKNPPLITHTPRHFTYDYTASGDKITEDGTDNTYAAWNNLPILLPGDTVDIIPDVPNASKITSQGQAVTGYVGMLFSNPVSSEREGPVNVTKKATYGGREGGTEQTFIQGFEIVGNEPVMIMSGGGGGAASDNKVIGSGGVEGTLGYYAATLGYKYHPGYIQISYQYVDNNDASVTFSEDQVHYYLTEGQEDPEVIWATDALYNYDAQKAGSDDRVTYNVYKPYVEGYSLLKTIVFKSSPAFNSPSVTSFDENGVLKLTPVWGSSSRTDGDYFMKGSYTEDWVAIHYEFLGNRTVTMDANGGIIDGFGSKIFELNGNAQMGALKTREENGGFILEREGYHFCGWSAEKDGEPIEGSIYDYVSTFSNNYSDPIEWRAAKLYAVWHKIDWVEPKASTTKEAGNIGYYKCDTCGAYFQDNYGRTEITDKSSVIIPKIFSGWKTVDGKKYYYDDDTGALVKGLREIGGKKYYFNPAGGVMKTGLITVGSAKYYFNPTNGVMKTGIVKVGSVKYYFNPTSGAMKTGLITVGSAKYYFNPTSGAMKTGIVTIKNAKYYFNPTTGARQVGWVKVGTKNYFFNKTSGAMKTGWVQEGKKWYYFDKNGVMATGTVKIGKKTYKFDTSGVCLNP